MRFNGVGALGMAVQLGTVWVLGTWMATPAAVATAVGVSAAVVHNFSWHRRWTWRDRPLGPSRLNTFVAFATANGAVSLAGNVVIVTLLTTSGAATPVAANVVAIAICSLVNFWTSDTVVFREA
jgi:putative flippase GtrA